MENLSWAIQIIRFMRLRVYYKLIRMKKKQEVDKAVICSRCQPHIWVKGREIYHEEARAEGQVQSLLEL